MNELTQEDIVAVLENIFSSILIHIWCISKYDEYEINFNMHMFIVMGCQTSISNSKM